MLDMRADKVVGPYNVYPPMCPPRDRYEKTTLKNKVAYFTF